MTGERASDRARTPMREAIGRLIADGDPDPELASRATHVPLHRALASIQTSIAHTEQRATA